MLYIWGNKNKKGMSTPRYQIAIAIVLIFISLAGIISEVRSKNKEESELIKYDVYFENGETKQIELTKGAYLGTRKYTNSSCIYDENRLVACDVIYFEPAP